MKKPSALLLATTCPENQGIKAVISVAAMFFLATIIVAMRFYVRLVMLHGATGWDDYFILGSLVSFLFLCSAVRIALWWGRGRGVEGKAAVVNSKNYAPTDLINAQRSPPLLHSPYTSNSSSLEWEDTSTACPKNSSST